MGACGHIADHAPHEFGPYRYPKFCRGNGPFYRPISYKQFVMEHIEDCLERQATESLMRMSKKWLLMACDMFGLTPVHRKATRKELIEGLLEYEKLRARRNQNSNT
jgi:hypothetical protein